jgi:hypothetical protein
MSPRKSGPRIERRRSARADASLSMRLEGQPFDGDLTKIVTESQNISASGVYCTSPHYLAPLSKVALTIILPSLAKKSSAGARRLLKCDGIVVRCLPAGSRPRRQAYELACSFVGLDPRHRDVIEEFVTWRNLEAIGRAADIRPPRRTTSRATPRTPSRRATSRARTKTSRSSTARRKTVRARGSSGR